jgi:CheY-like chemotaxis protein
MSKPAKGKTIILAEDDPFISRMYTTKLTSAGYKILWAKDGQEALDIIRNQHADMVMMDLNMPDLTGFEVMQELKKSGFDFKKTKFVILTNSANPADRTEAKEFGIDYLIKAELTPREVLEYLNTSLGVK